MKRLFLSILLCVFVWGMKAQEMDAGFVNLLAARQGKDKIGGFVAVKEGYEPIRMTAQPVKGAAGEADDVKAFLTWLGSPKADAVLEKFGVSR